MRKLIFCLAIVLASCSSDDEVLVDTYLQKSASITLRDLCNSTAPVFTLCVSPEEYDNVVKSMDFSNTCNLITIKDRDGDTRTGYFVSGSPTLAPCNQ